MAYPILQRRGDCSSPGYAALQLPPRPQLSVIAHDRLRECGATEEEVVLLRKRRLELNALSTEQLVKLIEDAFSEHGVEKVIPGSRDLTAAWRAAKARAEIAKAVEEASVQAARWLKAEAPDDLRERVRDLLERHPTTSWDAALRRIAGRP